MAWDLAVCGSAAWAELRSRGHSVSSRRKARRVDVFRRRDAVTGGRLQALVPLCFLETVRIYHSGVILGASSGEDRLIARQAGIA